MHSVPVPGLGWLFAGPIRAWSNFNAIGGAVSDVTSHRVSKAMQIDGEQRDRMYDGVYVPNDMNDPVGRLALTFKLVKEAEGIERKIKKAIKAKKLPKKRVSALLDQAVAQSVITQGEYDLIQKAEAARYDAIQVDDFSPDEYFRKDRPKAPENNRARPVTSHKSSVDEPIPNPDRREAKISESGSDVGAEASTTTGEKQPAVS